MERTEEKKEEKEAQMCLSTKKTNISRSQLYASKEKCLPDKEAVHDTKLILLYDYEEFCPHLLSICKKKRK